MIEVTQETGRTVLGAMSRVDQSDRLQRRSNVPQSLYVWHASARAIKRFVAIAAQGVRDGKILQGTARPMRRVDPSQCVKHTIKLLDRRVETTEAALVQRGIAQCQLHAPFVAAGAVELRLTQ
ncbi:MAG: hypothetical protein M3496_14815, partial [Pseudomonadota bacterium]|nr:hypothetical protein [Pseudomonadota bacterium]